MTCADWTAGGVIAGAVWLYAALYLRGVIRRHREDRERRDMLRSAERAEAK